MLFSSFTEFRRGDAELEARRVAIEEARVAESALRTRIDLVNAIVNARKANVGDDELARIIAGALPPPQAPP